MASSSGTSDQSDAATSSTSSMTGFLQQVQEIESDHLTLLNSESLIKLKKSEWDPSICGDWEAKKPSTFCISRIKK